MPRKDTRLSSVKTDEETMAPRTAVRPRLRDTYRAFIENSVGAKLFRTFYADVDGSKKDILKNGELACAFYVSAILKIFDLIGALHTSVDGTTRDLERSGWKKVKKPRPGSILLWEPLRSKNGVHKHIGFYVGNGIAISHRDTKKMPLRHHLTYRARRGKPKRNVIAIYWHPALDD